MVVNNNTRRYEVSLWTLQDSFIATLESYTLDGFGCIEDPELTLADDSEDTFSFKLPMYIRVDGELKENPNWYNVTDGNLIANLRKIKVIFFKGEPRQQVFEFIITQVTETHDGFQKTCEVQCEGLAYNELGKVGYNIELSQDIYEMEVEKGIEQSDTCPIKSYINEDTQKRIYYITLSQRNQYVSNVTVEDKNGNEIAYSDIISDNDTYTTTVEFSSIPSNLTEVSVSYTYIPINNINYWLNKVFEDDYRWSYRINMNWDEYAGEDRESDRIYEDAYIENWEVTDDYKFKPTSIVNSQEKFRIVSESGSNRYNLSQTIASTFGVYCRYIYEYDDNFHIINRVVEYYNNTLKEAEEIVDFTYYYDTEDITRTMDSADQITKMIVPSSGEDSLNNSITEVNANKSLENYLLNFNYLYDIGAIDKEQYEYIDEFEASMREYNLQLQELAKKIIVYQDALTEFKMKRDSAKLAEASAIESMEGERAYVIQLLNTDKTDYDKDPETLSMTGSNPNCAVIVDDEEKGKYCVISTKGVFPNTIVAFTSLNDANNYHDYIKSIEITSEEVSGSTKWSATFGEDVVSGTYNSEAEAYEAAKSQIITTKFHDGILSNSKYNVKIDPSNGFAIELNNINIDDSYSALFLTFSYSLDLYHKILAQDWASVSAEQGKLYKQYAAITDKIDGPRDDNDNWTTDYHGLLQQCLDEQEELLKQKHAEIIEFENYMGPALREGNWSSDNDYAKYGDHRQATMSLIGSSKFIDDVTSIGWDKNLFEGEQLSYYEYGIKQEKIYYPAIKLTANITNAIHNYIFPENAADAEGRTLSDIGFVWDDTAVPGINKLIDGSHEKEVTYPQIYHINAESTIAFFKSKTDPDEPVFPVLLFTNTEPYISTYNLKNNIEQSQTDIFKSLNGCIGTVKTEIAQENTDNELIKYIVTVLCNDSLIWIEDSDLNKYDIVYPRIKIPYSNFIENTTDCKLLLDDMELSPYEDYTINTRNDINSDIPYNDLTFWESDQEITSSGYNYYVTIKPSTIISEGVRYGEYTLYYKLSNVALATYLDAVKILKENSIPKVSYTVKPIILKTDFMENAYDKMHSIVHINDPELKFQNVAGYISGITLELDAPWDDDFEIKNYTTKFEDLFSTIVASSETIQKNNGAISIMSQAFVSTGQLAERVLQKSFDSAANLSLNFNNDQFIINDSGIKAYSDKGIVHYSNQGIFTANSKDEDGNWKWNTSILPTGINANSITTGQLDTSLIRIYSGDDLRFQMNENGLFAYKSWLNTNLEGLSEQARAEIQEEIQRRGGVDPSQYVVINEDGLFLTGKENAYIIDKDNPNYSTKLRQDVNRVEISWDGLILRNNENKKTFYADPDTGNLNITGNITIESEDISAELTQNTLRFGNYHLTTINTNDSECLGFVCYMDDEQ